MRNEFNENIKKFQDPKKVVSENNIPKQNANLPIDKKLARNTSATGDKKK